MKKSILLFSSLFAIIFINQNCVRINPEPPTATTLDSTINVPLSVITFPLSINVASLEQTINQELSGDIIASNIIFGNEKDSIYLEVKKTRPIRITWQDGYLYSQFPVQASGVFYKRVLGILITNANPIDARIVINLRSELEIGPDWGMVTNTKIRNLEWENDPSLKVGFVKINLKNRLEEVFFEKEKDLTDLLDKTVKKSVNTKKIVQGVWDGLQTPKPILGKEVDHVKLWLNPHIASVKVDRASEGEYILLQALVKAVMEITVADNTTPELIPLGKNELLQSDHSGIKIYINLSLPFEEITNNLNERLAGTKYAYHGKSIEIRKWDIYGSENSIIAGLKIKGDARGEIFFTGKPVFNPEDMMVSIGEFNYDFHTKNRLLSTANWLLQDDAISWINSYLKFDAGEVWAELPGIITEALNKGKSKDKIVFYIKALEIQNFNYLITKKNLELIFEIDGEGDMHVEAI